MRIAIEPNFFPEADDLRDQFVARVGPNRETPSDRFVWDYWHVPGQFTYVRTPALNVLAPSLLGRFTETLRAWGLANLGTDRITLPWLSYYIEGCRQELHSDVVQGMWSYVYSLTAWDDRCFTGGETLLGSPELLDYWSSFDPHRSTEARTLVERIPARYDQLTVFDSRLPHGVAVVEGTRNPVEARVALHGWFHDPIPAMRGGLDLETSSAVLDGLRIASRGVRANFGSVLGTSMWRVNIDPDGSVTDVFAVVDNLVATSLGTGERADVLATERSLLGDAMFERRDEGTELLLPLGE